MNFGTLRAPRSALLCILGFWGRRLAGSQRRYGPESRQSSGFTAAAVAAVGMCATIGYVPFSYAGVAALLVPGLTALLVASEPVFAAVRLLGAAYLIWLGLHSILRAIRTDPVVGATGRSPRHLPAARALRQGALSNLGNPKMAIFFSSLLPQFVAPGPSAALAMLSLGLVFVGMTLGWLSGYAVLVDRAGDVLRRPRVRRAVDAVMGAILVAFGARLAVDRR